MREKNTRGKNVERTSDIDGVIEVTPCETHVT